MEIEYIHFYVDDALAWRYWFVHRLGFWSAGGWRDDNSLHERVCSGNIRFLLSSALAQAGPVAAYLAQHPPGVVDVALRVSDLRRVLQRAKALGASLLEDSGVTEKIPSRPWATLAAWRSAGWTDLRHTLVEADLHGSFSSTATVDAELPPRLCWPAPKVTDVFHDIDHVVLNVAAGDLTEAVDWYSQLFALRSRQSFHIKTPHSGLRSQVLVSETLGSGGQQPLQFPINEPESPTSQIQDFLNHNHGPGIQHIALATQSLLPTVARLRHQQVEFLSVPPSYYHQLPRRPLFEAQDLGVDWPEIVNQQVLVDWHPERLEGPLLQIFTRPIFDAPTFFFELIERRRNRRASQAITAYSSRLMSGLEGCDAARISPIRAQGCAQGFGEGNFQALFEAMELEQLSREQLPKPQLQS